MLKTTYCKSHGLRYGFFLSRKPISFRWLDKDYQVLFNTYQDINFTTK